MSFQVSVILHGVPEGHKILGRDTDDRDNKYVQSFYNQEGWLYPEFLKAERIADKVYYTFIKCRNVFARDGRSGSYFGITLRMNCYYLDIQNIYWILKEAYQKMCIGTFVSDDGKNIRYLVSDFRDAGAEFESNNKRINEVIGSFSTAHDLLPLTPAAKTEGSKVISLADCTVAVAKNLLGRSGSLIVSALCPSHELQLLQNDYKRKLEQAQQYHSEELKAREAQSKQQLSALQQQLEREKRESQSSRKVLQDKVDQLNEELRKTRFGMQQQIDSLKADLKKAQSDKAKLQASLNARAGKSGAGPNSRDSREQSTGRPADNTADEERHQNAAKRRRPFLGMLIVSVLFLMVIVTNVMVWHNNAQVSDRLMKVENLLDSVYNPVLPAQVSPETPAKIKTFH